MAPRDFYLGCSMPASALKLIPSQNKLLPSSCSVEFFTRRDFELVGYAAESELLPLERRRQLPNNTPAQLYVKPIVELDASVNAPAGKRIGF
jgi:hypothetical protein